MEALDFLTVISLSILCAMSVALSILTSETPLIVKRIMWISMISTIILVSTVIAYGDTYEKCPKYEMIQEPVYKKINE